MDISVFILTAMGLGLQAAGLWVGGFGLLLPQIAKCSLFRAILETLAVMSTTRESRWLPGLDKIAKETRETGNSAISLEYPFTLFMLLLVCLGQVALAVGGPIALISGLVIRNDVLLLVGVAIVVLLTVWYMAAGAVQVLMSMSPASRPPFSRGASKAALMENCGLFWRLFVGNWVRTPRVNLIIIAMLLVIASAHWPAWLHSWVSRRTVNLGSPATRNAYYAAFSLAAFLTGTLLLFLAAVADFRTAT